MVRFMQMHPYNPQIIFAEVGNLFLMSTNGGIDWSDYETAPYLGAIYDIAVNPLDNDVIFASAINGLYKSINAGVSWEETSITEIANNVIFDPNDPSVVYAASASTIYKSVDNGNSWVGSATGINPSTWVNNIIIDSHNSQILYVATEDGVYRSLDAGVSWLTYNSGIPNKHVVSIFIHPEDSTILYALPEYTRGIYSTKTWDYTTCLPSIFR